MAKTRLKKITIKSFRALRNVEVEFGTDITVLCGKNGTVKSSILGIAAQIFSFDDDDISKHRHVIPALIPPLRLKPILSHRYIEAWHEASKRVRNAKRIAIVGYSFNNADEHFNDILRQQISGKEIAIIGPGVFTADFIERMSKVFSVPHNNYVSTKTQGLEAKKAGSITLVKAFADQFNIASYFENS